MISNASTDLDTLTQLGTTTKYNLNGGNTVIGTKVSAVPATPSADSGYALKWGDTDTWYKFDEAGKYFEC